MQEGFSIREYASRMRSVSMVKRWPFDDFVTEHTVDSFLPPIIVKKFSWWLDELEYSRSVMAINVGNSKRKKKMVEGKGETSLRGVEDVDESDMDVEKGLGVAKAPKKRSIVEIFAAAPLSVERMINRGEEEDNYDEELDGFSVNSKRGLKGKRNEKSKEKKKNKETMMSKLKNTKKTRDNFKNKKRRGDNIMDTSVPNKEKRLKLKSQTQDVANRNLIPLYSKEPEYGIRDHFLIHKRSIPHGLDADKKIMAHKIDNLMSDNQHQILPVRGILKNHAKVISVQNSAKSLLQEPIQLNDRGKQKENKHVSFSEKDDIVKLGRKSLLSVECLKVPILNGSDMDAASFCKDDVQEIDKDTTFGETSGNEELSNGMQQEINIGHSCKEPSTFHWCSIDTANYLKQHKMDDFFSGSVTSDQDTLQDLKKYLFESGLKEAPQIPIHACSPGFFCMPLECCCRTQNIKMMCDPSNSNCGSLVEDLWSSGSRFHPMCVKDYLDSCKKPSVPYLYNGGGISNMPQVSSQSNMDNLFPHPHPCQTFPNLSPKEYMQSLCSSTNGNQRGYLCEERSIYGLTESFLGLPLTLQGEFIKLNSSVDWDFCQMKSSMTADPSPSLSTCSNVMSKSLGNHSDCRNWDCRTSVDQLNFRHFEDNLKAKPLIVPSNLDFSKFQSNGKGNCDLGLIKLQPFQPDKSISNQNNQIQEFPGNEKILSTVRLMGKEFIVGGRIGEFRDTLTCSSEMKFTSENMHSLPQFHGQTTMHKNNFPVQTLYSTVSPDASFTVNRSKHVFPEALTGQYESQIFSLELPTSPALQDSHPILITRANELINKQNWLHTPKSAIRFPFMHNDIEGEVLSSQTRSCSLNPRPLFVDVLDEGRLFRYRHSNFTFANDHHSLTMLGTTLLD